jgi:gluconate 2-dehydrogenase gamma chain
MDNDELVPLERAPKGATEGVKRRDALKAMAAAATVPILASLPGEAEAQQAPAAAAPARPPATQQPPAVRTGPRGDAWDPDLINIKKDPRRLLTQAEMATLGALADVIIPADAKSPSATAVGAHHYINEHVSAAGASYERDLIRVRGGVSWLNLESQKRFQRTFVRLTAARKTAICDDICYPAGAKPEFQAAARFFSLVRNLVATGFYTTDAGMKDVGYVGNVALPKWELPPAAVLKQLGLG